MRQPALVLAIALPLALAGCATPGGPGRPPVVHHPLLYNTYSHDLIVRQTPPPFEVEVVGSRPGQVWAHGYARWDGQRFVKVPGRWLPARSGYRYVSAHWQAYHDGWHFKPGHWVMQ